MKKLILLLIISFQSIFVLAQESVSNLDDNGLKHGVWVKRYEGS